MTLADLLEALRADVLQDTEGNAVAGDDPRLWSDTALVRYIDEASREFAKRTLCLKVKRTFTTVAYQESYDIDDTIIAIQSMRFLGNGSYQNGVYTLNEGLPADTVLVPRDQVDLYRSGHAELQTRQVPDRYYWDVNQLDRLPPGKPYVWDTDEMIDFDNEGVSGVTSIRLYPICSPQYANCVIEMRYEAMPVPLTLDNLEAIPQIPYEYHEKLLDFAAYKALSIVDHEKSDPQRAQDFLATFKDSAELARRQIQRKTFVPLQWGFGGNGYSYVSN